MTSLATHYLAFLPMVSRISGDARVLPVPGIDFALDTGWQIDLTAAVQSAQLNHAIQSMFIDASQVPYGNTVVQAYGTGQQIVIPPRCQGYFPLLLTQNSFIFTFLNGSNQSGDVPTAPLPVFFMNVPYVTQLWSTVALAQSGGYGVGPLGGNPLGS
jgi:hypothetical protein